MIKANESVRVAVKRFSEAAEEAASYNGIHLSDARWIIPHQANLRIIQQVAKRLNVPFEKVYLTIEKYGNISSATIPIALDEAVRTGSIQKKRSHRPHRVWWRPHLGQQSDKMVIGNGVGDLIACNPNHSCPN